MTKIDRYITILFLRTMLICFFSIGGVFVVFHAFNNLDALTRLVDEAGSAPLALASYYGPYLLLLFDWTAAIISLMAMLFTVSWLRRSGELTSLLAAGVRHGRILRPMLVIVVGVIVAQWISRECVLPNYREVLTTKPNELRPDRVQAMLPSYDKSSGILIEGEGIQWNESRVEEPSFRLYTSFPGFGDLIEGRSAVWRPADSRAPSGYIVEDVARPAGIDDLSGGEINGRLVLLTRRDAEWLQPGQCFVATTLDLEVLSDNPRSTRMAGIPELIRRIRNGSVHSSRDLHTLLHERMLRAPLDLCLVLLGLPLVINRGDSRLFQVVGQAIGIVLMFFGIKTVAGAMANNGYLITSAMAAWAPLVLLGPLAVVRYWDAQQQ